MSKWSETHRQETWLERFAGAHWISALVVGSPQVKCLPVGWGDSRKEQQKMKSLAAGTDFDGPKTAEVQRKSM